MMLKFFALSSLLAVAVVAEDALEAAFEKMGSDFEQVLTDCGLDMYGIMDSAVGIMPALAGGIGDEQVASDMMTTGMEWLGYFQEIAKSKCSASENTAFAAALDDFHSCSGIDMQEFVAYLPSALVGTELECILDYLGENDMMTMLSDQPPPLPEGCADDILGANPLGDMIRTIYMHPDKALPCFAALSVKVPSCTYETWPIPMVGAWLKTSTCVMGGLKKLLDDGCALELQILSSCIPTSEGKSCAQIEADCADSSLVMNFPKPLLGAPLPDACQRVAGERGMSDALDRYDHFKKQCIDNVWNGWENPVSPSNKVKTSPGSASEALAAAAAPSNTSTKFGGSTTWAFATGLIVGQIILGLAVFVVARKKKQERVRFERLAEVELESSELRFA